MLGLLLLTLFLGAFVASCFGDILSGALRGPKDGGSSYQNLREAHASRTRRTPRGKRDGGQGWNLEISSLHCKPTTGGHRLGVYIYQKPDPLGRGIFPARPVPPPRTRPFPQGIDGPLLRYDLHSGDSTQPRQGVKNHE